MRTFVSTLFVCLALTGCTPAETAADATGNKEVEVLKKRLTKLENRIQNLEGRFNRMGGNKTAAAGANAKGAKAPQQGAAGKGAKAPQQGTAAKGAKAPPQKDGKTGSARSAAGRAGTTAQEAPTNPPVQVKVQGDAKQVMASRGDRKMRLPARLPPGKYAVLAAFGDKPLVKKGNLEVKRGQSVTVSCQSADESCSVK